MDPVREKRRQEISKALTFIQSFLPYPEPEYYQKFLTGLVVNLLQEGNACFRDGQWQQAVKQFSEGLDVSEYAKEEDICIPENLREGLYVNRASAFQRLGEFDRGVEDCDRALTLCKDSYRALYRKALCLKELGKFKEAYNCTTDCLVIAHQDKEVKELAQELSVQLGLKTRKPYVSKSDHIHKTQSNATNGNVSDESNKVSEAQTGNGLGAVSFPSMPRSTAPPQQPATHSLPDRLDTLDTLDTLDALDYLGDSDLMGDDLDSLLDDFSAEQTIHPHPLLSDPSIVHMAPVVLPAPTPQLPPAFFTSASGAQLNSLDSFAAAAAAGHSNSTPPALDSLDDLLSPGGLDALDSFSGPERGPDVTSGAVNGLDSLDNFTHVTPPRPSPPPAAAAAAEVKAEWDVDSKPRNKSLDVLDDLDGFSEAEGAVSAPVSVFGGKTVAQLDSLDSLDVLDSLDLVEGSSVSRSSAGKATAVSNRKAMKSPASAASEASVSHPLFHTHEFLQACSLCFPREGQSVYSFVHRASLLHSCEGDILLCRRQEAVPAEWTRVRPLPPCTSFKGPFILCRELQSSGELGVCKYGEDCTFAFNQLEIDVWTEERKGTLNRTLLFESAAAKLDPVTSILRLLQEHKGTYMFLCRSCYDGKPRIISKRCKSRPTVCSNMAAPHTFDANKCLAFVVWTHNVTYRKVRPLSVLCRLDLCYNSVRNSCQREDECLFAHSFIELKTWRIQQDTGISAEEIVKVAAKHYEKQEQNSGKHKSNPSSAGSAGIKPKPGGGAKRAVNMTLKMACGQCWRDGQITEADKALKYCAAKARHTWTKERRLLLVRSLERSRWVQVRALPHNKNFPTHYEMCAQVLGEKKRCTYTGNCTFAHSQEERELWTYMKNNNLLDHQQVYDQWLTTSSQNRQLEEPVPVQPTPAQSAPEEKYIIMPTDYAEQTAFFHCRLCGRHSNSERQWQQHISSDKHKARVFSCEGEEQALTWSYRFPGRYFDLCPRLNGECPDGVSCDHAHSPEELQEWTDRRDFLRQKLASAREDMLIMPDDCDFGNYNFLLRD